MQGQGTKLVRIWPEIHRAYREISDRYRFILSNLISSILLEAGKNSSMISYTLIRHFNIDPGEAEEIAEKLRKLLVEAYGNGEAKD